MKNLFLLMMIALSVTNPVLGQKSLPPSIQSYATHWSYNIKQMLQAAGFDVPGPQAKTILKPVSGTRSNELQLDSTVTYFGYPQNGALDSMPLFRFAYTYPQSNREVIVESFYDFGIWIPLTRTTQTSDPLGRLTEAVAETFHTESGTYVPDSKVVVIPRGDSPTLVDSFFIYAWITGDQIWKRQLAAWNTYDVQNQLKESFTSIEFFDFPLRFADVYTYNASGQVILIESYIDDSFEVLPAGKQEFVYQGNVLLSTTMFSSDDLGGFYPLSLKTYTYTVFGKVETTTHFTWDGGLGEWNIYQIDSIAYDARERVVLSHFIVINEEGDGDRGQIRYAYVRDEYPALETSYRWNIDSMSWNIDDKRYYYYQELISSIPDEPSQTGALFMWPNPTTGMVQIKLTGKISVHVYALSGQLIYRHRLQPGEKIINLTSLPPGVYQVRAQSDDDYYSGKLVIQ